MTWRSEEEAEKDALPEEALSNPVWLRVPSPYELQAREEDDARDAAEQRFIRERFEQEQAAPTFQTECVMCGAALFVHGDPSRHDHTCQTCEQGWRR